MEHLYPIAACVVLLLVLRQSWHIHLAIDSMHWAHTVGKVTKVWVEDAPLDDEIGSDGTHSAHAHYRYQVGARWYEGKRLTYRVTWGLRFGEALGLIRDLHVGREVDVFYDPRKPERAVLVPGSATTDFVAAVFSVVTFAWLLWQLRH